MPMTIRPMTPDDVTAAAEIVLRGDWGDRRAFFEWAARHPEAHPFVAEREGGVVGTAVGTANGLARGPEDAGDANAFVDWRPTDLDEMAALDREATGEDRAHLLRAFATP